MGQMAAIPESGIDGTGQSDVDYGMDYYPVACRLQFSTEVTGCL